MDMQYKAVDDLDGIGIMVDVKEECWTKSFTQWMVSIDGNKKPPRSAKQIADVVMSVVKFVDADTLEYRNLFNKDKILEWNTDIDLKRQKAGTIKNYIEATRIFYM